jgi:hypothetical protein
MRPAAGAGTDDVATPRDYSERMYRYYLELADIGHDTRRLIEVFLPLHHASRIVQLEHGFELEMPIQCAPDLIRHLAGKNIAIYQLVRLGRTKGRWRK